MVRTSNGRSTLAATPRVKTRAEARRVEILRAAARVFRRRGYATAGMREIAAEAGLSPGNLYHYFRGKDEILFFCQDRTLGRMLEALEAARLSGRACPDRIGDVIRAHVRCVLDDLEGSAAHLEIDVLAPDRRATIVRKRDRYERGLRRLVAAGIRSGELRAGDPTVVTRAILGAANWTVRWFRPEGPRSAHWVADALADYLTGGLREGRATSATPPRAAPAGGPR